MTDTDFYKMRISRTTVDKLGVKMYDKVAAVVAELVANAYDADSTEVTIQLPLGVYLARSEGENIIDNGYEIVVEDNGHGMTPDEINDFYLFIGKDRRSEPKLGDITKKFTRKVMGHKGVGKLAPFGICKIMEVISSGGDKTAKGYLTAHLILDFDRIMGETDEMYHPQPGDQDQTYRNTTGTTIRLRNFARRQVPNTQTFHRQIARRFGIDSPDWAIKVVDTQNRDNDFTVGSLQVELLDNTQIDVDDRPVPLGENFLPVKGWVACSKDPYHDEEMAGIRIYVRGKIAAQTRDFGLGAGFTGEHTLRSYLVGQITAEWLDEGEDLIRTDRQDILWDSDKGQALRVWGQRLLKELGATSTTSRQQKSWELFAEKSNIKAKIKERFSDNKMQAEALTIAKFLGKKADLESLQDDSYITNLSELALTIAPHSILVNKLHTIGEDADSPLEVLIGLFTEAGVAELASLGQVVSERLHAIGRLEEKIRSAVNETDLQKLIEGAPWLIDPTWTVLSRNQSMETVRLAFEEWYQKTYGEPIVTTTIDRSDKRPDFILLGARNSLEIVEIKKADHVLQDKEFTRLAGYIDALAKFLKKNPSFQEFSRNGIHATLVCDETNLSVTPMTALDGLKETHKLNHKTWQEFLKDTKKVHEDFLELARTIRTS